MRIYLDTSVINGLYSNDPKIKAETIMFFKNAEILNYSLYSSDATIEEIEKTPQENKRILLKKTVVEYNIDILPVTEEMRMLAKEYVKTGLIPGKYFPDAFHIAAAVIYNIPVLASWNFEHMVKAKTKLGVNKINQQQGYPIVEICSPQEV